MAGSDDDWAGNSVPWNPELPVFEPSHNLLLESGPWTVPYADFTPPPSPFALEMRAESIEHLVGGDALRRGESERIEAGRSGTNADAVAGRDRVRVQGTLHEHTGHGLAEQVAHLDTTVDGRLDVHTGNEDTVLLAGHMKDIWDGGTAIVAAMTDDLVAGGGVRVTAPLDLWVHGLMGVEERIGTCTADAVLLELGATHYEREYGPGVHAVGLAVYNGSLYLSNRSSFRPLMRVSSGVRNLIAGGGGGGAGDAPDASPPPAPAAAGAGAEAASETLCAATDGARTVEAVVEAGARSDDLTGTRRFSNATDAVRSEDLAAMNQAPAAQLDDLRDSLRPAGDETGGRAGTGSPYNAGSDWRVPQEGVERSDTQMEFIDEFLRTFNTMLDDQSRDTSGFAHTDDFSGLAHSPNAAEQLEALKRGDTFGVGILVPELGRTPTERPYSLGWEEILRTLQFDHFRHQWVDSHTAADAVQAAVDAITDKTLTTYLQLGGKADDLHPKSSGITQAIAARRILEQIADRARQAGDLKRADEIAQALREIDHHTYQTVAGLSDSFSALGGQGASGVDDLHYAGEVPDASISVPAGDETSPDLARFEGYEPVPSADVPEPPEIPPDRGWASIYADLSQKFRGFRKDREWYPVVEYSRAVVIVSAEVRVAYMHFGGNAADLTRFAGAAGTPKIYQLIEEMATQADAAGEAERAAKIREALKALDQLTFELVTNLVERAADFDGTSAWMAKYQRLDPAIDEVKLAKWIGEQIDALGLGRVGPGVATEPRAMQPLRYEHAHLTDMMREVGRGREPRLQSQFRIDYLQEIGQGEHADIVTALHARLVEAMADPQMYRTDAVPGPVRQDLASLPSHEWEFRLGSPFTEEMYSQASLRFSAGGSIPATPVVGAAPRLDARAVSWPGLEDAFRLTNDLEFLSGSQRAGEELSNVPHGLDESYVATDFDTFRRIDDAPADAPDEIRPRTGSSSEWEGGRSGTSSGQGGIGFGQAEVEGASPPGRQAGETPGFGRLEPPPAADFQFSDRERIVQRLMKGDPRSVLSVEDVGLLRERFLFGYRFGEISRQTEQSGSMMFLIGHLTFLANSPKPAPDRYMRFSDADWQALELLLSLLETPRRRS